MAAEMVASAPAGSPEAAAFELNASLYGECGLPDDPLPEVLLPFSIQMALARKGAISWRETENLLLEEVRAYRMRMRPA